MSGACAVAGLIQVCWRRRYGQIRQHASDAPHMGWAQPPAVAARRPSSAAGRMDCVLLAGAHLKHLAPFWRVILTDYGVAIGWHLALVLVTVAAALYGVARAAGLADLGRRVDLVERRSAAVRVIRNLPTPTGGMPAAIGTDSGHLSG